MNRSKLIVLAMIIVAIFIVGGFAFLISNRGNTNNTANTTTPLAISGSQTPITTVSGDLVNITIRSTAFPDVTTIKQGQTVNWTNNDGVEHTVSFDTIGVESGNISVGKSFSHKFDEVGSFSYHCSLTGTTGKIVVE